MTFATISELIFCASLCIASYALGSTHLLGDIAHGIHAAIQRRRDRAERVLPDVWALHVAGLSKPAIYRRKSSARSR